MIPRSISLQPGGQGRGQWGWEQEGAIMPGSVSSVSTYGWGSHSIERSALCETIMEWMEGIG